MQRTPPTIYTAFFFGVSCSVPFLVPAPLSLASGKRMAPHVDDILVDSWMHQGWDQFPGGVRWFDDSRIYGTPHQDLDLQVVIFTGPYLTPATRINGLVSTMLVKEQSTTLRQWRGSLMAALIKFSSKELIHCSWSTLSLITADIPRYGMLVHSFWMLMTVFIRVLSTYFQQERL